MGDRQIESLYSGAPGKSRVVKTHIRISTTFSERWRTIFSCCFRGLTKRKASIQDYDPEECDYIVEKLVVKRVPIALFATPYDIYDRKRIKKREYDDEFPPVRMTDTKNIYRVIPDMHQPLYYAMNDTHDKPSTSIHFAKSTDTLHEDAIFNYDKNLETERQNEYLNRFTALHPDLKECDRPPKDPCPLNLQSRNKRSLAEDISEIASTRIGSPRMHTRGNYKTDTKAGAVYVTVSDTSRELSMLSVDEEFPTRDTPFSIRRNASNCSKIESVALLPCFSFSQKNSQEHVNKFDLGNHSSDSAKSKSRSDISSDDKSQDYESPKGKQNYVVAPVSVHYAPRQLESFSKSVESSNKYENVQEIVAKRNNTLATPKIQDLLKSTDLRNSSSAMVEESTVMDHSKNDNLAGTTLRWKIIIKHRPSSDTSQLSSPRDSEMVERIKKETLPPTKNTDFQK